MGQMNRWFLHDLPNPDTWLQVTSPKPIVVTNRETSDALSVLKFRWNPFRRVGTFIRNTVASRGRGARASLLPPDDTHAHHAMSSNLSQKRKESERRAKSHRRAEDSTGTMSEPDMRLKSYRHSGSEEVNRKQKKSRDDDRGKQKAQDDAERLDVVYKNRRPMSTMNLEQGSSGQASSRRSSQGLDSEQRSKSSDDGLRKAAQRSRQAQRLASPGLSQVVHEVHNATSLPSDSQALRAVIAQSTVTPIAAPAAAATSNVQSRRGSDARSNHQQREWCSCMTNALDSDSESEPSSPRASSVNSGYGELKSPPSSSSMLAPRSPSQSLSPTGSHSRSHSKTPSFSSFHAFNLSSHSITRLVRPGKAKARSRPGTPTSPVTLTPTSAKLWTGTTTPTGSVGSNISSSPSTTRKGLSGILTGFWKQSRSQSHQEQPPLVGKYKEKEKFRAFTAPTTSVPSPQSDYAESPIDALQEGDLIKSVQRKAVLGASPSSTSGPGSGSGSGSAGQSRDNLLDAETYSAASASNTALDSSKTVKPKSSGKRSSKYLSPNVPVQRSSTKPFGYQSMAFKTGAGAGGDVDMVFPNMEMDMDVGSLERRTSSWDHDNREFEDFTSIHSDDYGLAVRDVDDHVVYAGAGGIANRQELEDAERKGQQRWTEELHRKRAVQQERMRSVVMGEPHSDDEASDDEYDGNEDGDSTEPVQRHRYDAHFRHSQAYVEDEEDDSEVLTFSARKKRNLS
ncbi:hypothetical protein D9758_010184 [Tetrapyrgos nigripes]|uniref:Uncharacterized protein n=1 Tax=Tetrapyrgos nigripes TaxID=182062 RepID=A0A8H5CXI2_9AGAR|nr:hypothetical protein D9758_010184 [Tetrapyrgos nigripes]